MENGKLIDKASGKVYTEGDKSLPHEARAFKASDKVTISGPYGEFFIKDTEREMV